MNCRQAERWLLRSFDGRLTAAEREKLRQHVAKCSRCQRLESEYKFLLPLLKADPGVKPLPFFQERLQKKLEAVAQPTPEIIWQPILVKAATLALIGLVIITGLMVLVLPVKSPAVSQSEALVFQSEEPFPEVQQILNETQPEQRNLRLMFSSLEARELSRRYFP